MDKKLLSDPLKMVSSFLVSLFLLSYATYYSINGLFPGAIVFGILGLVFLISALFSATSVSFSADGIACCSITGKRKMSWDEIKEIGVVGIHFIPSTHEGKRTRKFIYFSAATLEDWQRNRLTYDLSFRKTPFLAFRKEAYEVIRAHWSDIIIFLNTGKFEMDLRDR